MKGFHDASLSQNITVVDGRETRRGNLDHHPAVPLASRPTGT
jgi:hypothetical protein